MGGMVGIDTKCCFHICTDLVNDVVVRLKCTLCVFHLLNHVCVQTEAECIFVVNQGFEDKVQAFLNHLQLLDAVSLFQEIAVR